jgi:uncharacterized protein (DUF1697 family)
MERLRDVLDALGFEDLKTYVQSGNVVFKAATQAPEKLARKIEDKLLRQFGFSVPVLVKTSDELILIIKSNPFLKEPGVDPSQLHVTFLSCMPDQAALNKLEAIAAGADRFRCSGQAIYLHCPNGYGTTKLSNNALERALAVSATTRNWRTVNKLREMTDS